MGRNRPGEVSAGVVLAKARSLIVIAAGGRVDGVAFRFEIITQQKRQRLFIFDD